MQHDPVPVAGYRDECAVPSVESRLLGNAVRNDRLLDGDIVTHEPDEGGPDGERLSAVLENGAGEGGGPPAAASAAPPRDAGGGGAVPPGAAPRTFRVRQNGCCGLGERIYAGLITTAPLVNGFSGQQELVGGEGRHGIPERVRSSHMDLFHPPRAPTRRV